MSPFGLFWYTLDSGWVRSDESISVYGGPLGKLSDYKILEISTLPDGDYIFFFRVDENMDGVLDMNSLLQDSVPVEIRNLKQKNAKCLFLIPGVAPTPGFTLARRVNGQGRCPMSRADPV